MPEKLIPCTKKQHDQIVTLKAAAAEAQQRFQAADRDLSVYVQPFVDALDEDLPPSQIVGARCTDGVYALVLNVPEAKPEG